ncbi:MAG: S1/P1 nuclease, partial [Acidobacteria bacterium]|nr:S1/P1 nuclease [Acidobacteriota bacterium]
LFLVYVTLSAATAWAWDDVGHKITGYIAWQRMAPQARDNVIRVLRTAPEDSHLSAFYMAYGPEPEAVRKREYFELVTTWADIIRDRAFDNRYKKYHRSNWHYDDFFWRQTASGIELVKEAEEGGQAVRRLVEFDRLVRDAAAADRDKAIAIAWIMHLGGDIHQPLHTSARVTDLEPKGDQGGNLFLLMPQSTPRADQVNLHWFWDSIVGRNMPIGSDNCGREYVEQIAERMMNRHPFSAVQGKLQLGNYEEWKKESFALNNTVVFSLELRRFEMPSQKYKRNAFRVAERQLAMAGYRLGETLNNVFNYTPPAAPGR